nr:MAG TPA: hypothetical protein [Caudoviricetes sp.]
MHCGRGFVAACVLTDSANRSGGGAPHRGGGGPSRSPVQKVDSDVLIFFLKKLVKIFNNYNSLSIRHLRFFGV